MNISCSICAELFRGPDAHNLHVTRCGHVFHNECLSKWLDRKNTCPECRSKTTSSTVIRLYVNIADSSYADESDGAPDLVNLQSENDNLKFRIIEKDGALKSKEDALSRLREENQKLTTGQSQSRNVILALEQKLESNRIIISAHNDQVKALRSRLSEIDRLKERLKEAEDKNRTGDLVQHLIFASQQETEELLKEGRTNLELATMVTTLKRELRNSNAKRAQVRSTAEELNKQLKLCKEEKIKLEEKCSVLESRVFQLESNNPNDSTDRLNNSENISEKKSPTDQSSTKRTFGEHLNFHKKSVTFESGRNFSPSTCVKSSSIAGLSPLLKRSKVESSKSTAPVNNEKTETFSIMRKPRLIQRQTKKSDLRPLRMNNVTTSVEKTTASSDLQITNHPFANGLSSQTSSLNNRFRMGSLSKPN